MESLHFSRREFLDRVIKISAALAFMKATFEERLLSAAESPRERTIEFRIGDTTIKVIIYEKKGVDITLVHLHSDEETAFQAAKDFIDRHGGRLISLNPRHKDRLISFTVQGREYTVDPNRIFSDQGIERTLSLHSSYQESAHSAVKSFTRNFIEQFALNQCKVVVAVHNNTEGRFSAESYTQKDVYKRDALAVSMKPGSDSDNFFLVTEGDFFDALKPYFNIVLQDNQNVFDDGSLSVYCGRKRIPYVNIETQHGHLEEQKRMLNALLEMRLL